MDSSQNEQTIEENKIDDSGYNYPQDVVSQLQEKYSPFTGNSENEVEISVSDPISKESGLTKYTVYNIKGQDSKDGPFDTHRRYNEFFVLRNAMVSRWPGCFIPPIPSKKAIGNKDESVIEDRKRHLNHFCHKVANISYLYNSQEFQLFLRSKENDVSKTLEKLPKQTVSDIVEKYKSIFSELNGKEIDSEILLKISNTLGFLKKAKNQLHTYRVTAGNIAAQKRAYNHNLQLMLDQLLPSYETQVFSEYIAGDEVQMVFSNDKGTPKTQEFRKALQDNRGTNPFLYIYDMICFEYRDCEAFIEAISQKDLYEKKRNELQAKIRDQQDELQNLHQGKTSIKSFFSKGNNEEKKQNLDTQITNNNLESDAISTLLDMITGILGFIQIDQFKSTKKSIYYSVMKSVAALETIQTQQLAEMWSEIGGLSQDLLNN